MPSFARDQDTHTTLHILTPTWNVGSDKPALGVLCRTDSYTVTDERVGRDDLLCGRCMNVWQSLCEDRPADPITKNLSYSDYLASEHWQQMRRVAREHYGDRCVLCGATDELDVHHRTYERRGQERLSDLTVLCRDCHASFHAKSA